MVAGATQRDTCVQRHDRVSAAEDSAECGEYLAATRHPWACVLFVLPLLAAYEAGVLALGTGQPEYEGLLAHLQERYPGRVRACLTFDAALAQRIYAGADMFLMPSRFEPCGLGQMIAMRYGRLADGAMEFSREQN